MEQIVGLTAGFLTTVSMLPQLIKALRTRNTRDLSLGMLSILFLGIILWMGYGLMKNDLPLILANATSLVLVGPVVILKLKYG